VRLGELLRRDRKRLGLSLAQAAGRIGIKPAKLRRIEEGETITEFDDWDRIVAFYGWPRSWV
jgi:cytoskeletal protein RodZ